MTNSVIHVRTIEASVVKTADDEIEVTGRLIDKRPGDGPMWFGVKRDPTLHDMTLTIRVRHPGLTIVAASAGMTAHPYTVCPEILSAVQRLVGLSVVHGFTRAVNERLGREHGCAHLTSLIHAMAPALASSAQCPGPAPPDRRRH